jgi:hypothetical protein
VRFADAPGTALLGARCRIGSDGVAPDLALVLLEPITEGRLAATLARHDEGPAAVWVVAATGRGVATDGAVPGRPTWPDDEQPGPFGPERLLPGVPQGPHRLVVRPPGTIRP